jgi:O-antigen/teichoic acid export membrane protein
MSNVSQKLVSGSALRVANVGAATLISVLILPFIIRMLGDRMYGVWTLVATFIGYYGVLYLGLNTAVTRYLSRSLATQDHEESNRVFNSALRIYLGLAVVVLLVAVTTAFLSPFFAKSRQDARLFFAVILILGVSLALQFPTRVFTGALEAHLRFDQTAGFDLLTLALRSGLIIVILLGLPCFPAFRRWRFPFTTHSRNCRFFGSNPGIGDSRRQKHCFPTALTA